MVVMYLFTRYRFNWDEVDFSIFSTYSMCTNLLGKCALYLKTSTQKTVRLLLSDIYVQEHNTPSIELVNLYFVIFTFY